MSGIIMSDIIEIFIYRDSHLPEEGWLQSCFKCKEITGKYFLFQTFYKEKDVYEFYIHTCSKCKKKFDNYPLVYVNFGDKCNKYIRKHFAFLFTS